MVNGGHSCFEVSLPWVDEIRDGEGAIRRQRRVHRRREVGLKEATIGLS